MTPPNPQTTTDINKRIQQYVQLRDALKAFDERKEAERKKITELFERVSGIIQEFLKNNNLQNIKSEHGTAHLNTRFTASLADPEAFMQYVISNGKFDLLDRRANATAVKAFVEQTKNLPPGCNLNAIVTVGVRRPTGTS